MAIIKIYVNTLTWWSLNTTNRSFMVVWAKSKKGRLPIIINKIAIVKIISLWKKLKDWSWVENPPVEIVVKLCATESKNDIPKI